LIRILTVIAIALSCEFAVAEDCGPESPCEIEGGSYHLRVPDNEGPRPVLIWYHGHRGNGASIHRGGGLQRDFLEHGYILLAPNGYQRSDGARSYPAREGSPRDDVAFTFAALDDAGKRASIDFERVYVGGFSAGGSMAWLLACEAGDRLAGVVSVAGALRRPNSTSPSNPRLASGECLGGLGSRAQSKRLRLETGRDQDGGKVPQSNMGRFVRSSSGSAGCP